MGTPTPLLGLLAGNFAHGQGARPEVPDPRPPRPGASGARRQHWAKSGESRAGQRRGSRWAAGGGGAAGHLPWVELVNDAFEANDGEEARTEAGKPGQEKDGEGEQRLPAGRLRQTPGQPRRGRLRRRHAARRLVRALGPGPVVTVPAVPQSHEAAPRGRVEGRLVLALRGRGLRHVVPRRRVSLLAVAAAAAWCEGCWAGTRRRRKRKEEGRTPRAPALSAARPGNRGWRRRRRGVYASAAAATAALSTRMALALH